MKTNTNTFHHVYDANQDEVIAVIAEFVERFGPVSNMDFDTVSGSARIHFDADRSNTATLFLGKS